jgi:uncharacterized membrane protein YeaQ/YmgE (transglycosylase-associated protein family)
MHYWYVTVVGLVTGLIARAPHPGKDDLGLIMTAILGTGGSFAGTFIGQSLGFYKPGENAGFIMSLFGAIVLLVLYGLTESKK